VSEHTPGPWKARWTSQRAGTDAWVGHRVANGSLDEIAALLNSVPQGEERIANARLIAACPDLLEACKHAANSEHHPACKAHGEYSANPELYCTCHVQKALAAITKTEGEPPCHAT